MADRSLVAAPVDDATQARLDATPASLFDRVPGIYAFWREHLFRDDTARIVQSLWPDGRPAPGARLLELGCGPGFYARRLAARFPELATIGIDRSLAQLEQARARLVASALPNCRFDLGDATMLPYPDGSVDAVVSARFLSFVDDRDGVMAEVHRVLQPGGRCFVSEPRSAIRAAIPMAAMRLAVRIAGRSRPVPSQGPDDDRMTVLSRQAFGAAVRGQPWRRIHDWTDGAYQYAVLEKGGQPE